MAGPPSRGNGPKKPEAKVLPGCQIRPIFDTFESAWTELPGTSRRFPPQPLPLDKVGCAQLPRARVLFHVSKATPFGEDPPEPTKAVHAGLLEMT